MRTKLCLTFFLSFIFCLLSSQIPQGFNYQAIARDGSGNPIVNTTLQVKIAILSDLVPGTVVWEELHSSVQTNAFGLFTLVIGSGTRQSGVSSFNEINWSATSLFLRSQIYYNSAWKDMGSSQLWTVPYAMIADDLAGSLKKLAVTGETASNEEALFEVKNKTGNTVFAVYNEGVRVYVADGDTKGVKGGFAIGGFDNTKGTVQEYFVVNPDSIRAYIDDTPEGKGVKGGFAIGGFDNTKALTQEYLKVSPDSIRLYVDNNPAAKGVKGGFAIGGFDNTKGSVTSFTTLTPNNYFIGQGAGRSITTGLYNSFLGYEAGASNSTGTSNILMGYRSGFSNKAGSYNIFMGDSAGVLNTNGEVNVFMGFKAGASNTTGSYNVFLGDSSGVSNTTGRVNVIIGNWAGYQNTTGSRNIIIGTAGYENTTGNNNVFMGTFAGTYNHEGNNNVFIGDYSGAFPSGTTRNTFIGKNSGGHSIKGNDNVFLGFNSGNYADSTSESVYIGAHSGYFSSGLRNVFLGAFSGLNNTLGSDNVFLGYDAGSNETSSHKLYVANSGTGSPLIYGEFDNGIVVINGNATDNLLARTFFVNGEAGGKYAWYEDSDSKLKHDIATIPDALHKVLELRGVNFLWNEPAKGMSGLQMGFIGQEVVDIVPEVVSVSNDHYSMQYAPITALLVEGMKEQQKQIESAKKENLQLKSELDELKALVNSLIVNQEAQSNY
jgi:hypothetical protein